MIHWKFLFSFICQSIIIEWNIIQRKPHGHIICTNKTYLSYHHSKTTTKKFSWQWDLYEFPMWPNEMHSNQFGVWRCGWLHRWIGRKRLWKCSRRLVQSLHMTIHIPNLPLCNSNYSFKTTSFSFQSFDSMTYAPSFSVQISQVKVRKTHRINTAYVQNCSSLCWARVSMH